MSYQLLTAVKKNYYLEQKKNKYRGGEVSVDKNNFSQSHYELT